jgi:hypothetical protein
MTFQVGASPTPPPQNLQAQQTLGNGSTQPGNVAPIAGATAAGNVGLTAISSSAIDRAMDYNYVIPEPEKPRPPMYALELKGNSELVRQVNTLLYDKNATPQDIMQIMELIKVKVMELSITGEMESMKDREGKIKENQKAREKELQVAKEKAVEAYKNKDWNKFWGMMKAVGSVVLSAAIIAAGVMSGNPLLACYGVYMMINATMDVVDAVRAYQDKEPIGFRLSVGELAGWIAKEAFDADEKTQAWVNAGFEIAFGVVMSMGVGAVSAGKAAAAADAANKVSKAYTIGLYMGRVGQVIQGVSGVAQGYSAIQTAYLKYDQAESKAKLAQLNVIYDQIQKQLEQSNDLLKTLNEAMASVWETAADRLKNADESQKRIWGGGRRNMV